MGGDGSSGSGEARAGGENEASDERARSFYQGHGFERIERLPDNFESGDGLLLARSLG